MSPLVLWLWIALGTGIVIGLASFVPEYLGLRRRHREQCDSYDRLHADGAERLTAFAGDLAQTQALLADTKTELATWQRKAKTEAAEKDDWHRKFEETSEELADLTRTLSARDARLRELAAEIARFEAEAARLKETIATLRADLMTAGDRIAAIEAQLDDATQRLVAKTSELAEARSKFRDAEASHAALSAERDHIAADRDRIAADRHVAVERLDRERTTLLGEIDRLKEVAISHEGNAGNLGIQVKKLIAERDEMAEAHTALSARESERAKTQRKLEDENLALVKKRDEMAHKIEDLEEILRKLSEQVDKGAEPPRRPEPDAPRYHETSTES